MTVPFSNESVLGLTALVKLDCLLLNRNKIEKIEGLETLVNLEVLDLSDNRIKAIENLSHLSKLEVLTLSVGSPWSANGSNGHVSEEPHQAAGEARRARGSGAAWSGGAGNRDVRRPPGAGKSALLRNKNH